ncbi:hypothetical protein FRB94_008121 [Tulasnella sp. JGI-2019a]|nr:hypothetical protein FRB94_008121 [Tulasnella sp. JGI-2019a]KAG9017327.1 hypothetical protein FRB93_007441 [Tulasnella sp. JGI-2019a]KAG9034062.1 hypothetical protein FRB95_013831 [Tulasnella sp. JGI-2019a]
MSNIRWMKKHWYAPEAIPIYVVIGGTVLGAGWYISRLARGPAVVWDRKNNPTPWLDVEKGAQTKMLAINQKHEGSYSRDKL